MGLKAQKKTIDGHEIMVTQFPARRALEYKFKLVKLLGKSIASLLSGYDKTKGLTEQVIDSNKIGEAIDALFIATDPRMAVEFILELLQSTRYDGREIDEALFDLEFAGDLAMIYKILGYVLEVNYGSFLSISGILSSESSQKIPQNLNETTATFPKNSKRS